MKVYLDNAATAPIKEEVLEAMVPYLKDHFGNPSSIHQWGRIARKAVDEAREKVANFLGAEALEIVFTSGGTEADNLAIRGLVKGLGTSFAFSRPSQPTRPLPNSLTPGSAKSERGLDRRFAQDIPSAELMPHIVTSQFEHHAVSRTCEELEKEGSAEVIYIKPNKEGIVEVEDIRKSIKPNTVLVSIMYVNNEIGTIQPIREIGKMIEKENHKRKSVVGQRIYFHTDAVQAAEYLPMNVDYLHVDLLTISGHKIGTPKGIGVLYIRKGTPVAPIIHGGEQESGMRAGTENVAGIVALGKAVKIIGSRKSEVGSQIKDLGKYFIQKVTQEIPEVYLNGSVKQRAPHIINFYFKFIEGESIVISMDLAGVACSTGSACTSQSLEPSHVIMACYNDPKRAAGSVRFSLNEQITKGEIDYVIRKLKEVIKKLREISPYGSGESFKTNKRK